MNGTSPEIPDTVDADPYATAGKARAAARPGERGPASTGASRLSYGTLLLKRLCGSFWSSCPVKRASMLPGSSTT